jgi:hypothetical protein
MDRATGWYPAHHSKKPRQCEEEMTPGVTPVLAGRQVARLVGCNVSDQQAAKIGSVVHRALGMSYGMAGAALARAAVWPQVVLKLWSIRP